MNEYDGAAHILSWAENDGALYKDLRQVAVMGNFITANERYNKASALVQKTIRKAVRASDMRWRDLSELDIARAVVLFLTWKPE